MSSNNMWQRQPQPQPPLHNNTTNSTTTLQQSAKPVQGITNNSSNNINNNSSATINTQSIQNKNNNSNTNTNSTINQSTNNPPSSSVAPTTSSSSPTITVAASTNELHHITNQLNSVPPPSPYYQISNGIQSLQSQEVSQQTLFGNDSFTEDESNRIQLLLERKLSVDEMSTRTGGGKAKLWYLETSNAINFANYIFDYNGWSSSIREFTLDYLEDRGGRIFVGLSCLVKVTLKDGTFHEDVGYGTCANMPDRGSALEKAKKEAASDGLKRALRLFGNGLGNTIYDKDYLNKVTKGQIITQPLDLSNNRPKKRQRSMMPISKQEIKEQEMKEQMTNSSSSFPPPVPPSSSSSHFTSPLQQNTTMQISPKQNKLAPSSSNALSGTSIPTSSSSSTTPNSYLRPPVSPSMGNAYSSPVVKSEPGTSPIQQKYQQTNTRNVNTNQPTTNTNVNNRNNITPSSSGNSNWQSQNVVNSTVSTAPSTTTTIPTTTSTLPMMQSSYAQMLLGNTNIMQHAVPITTSNTTLPTTISSHQSAAALPIPVPSNSVPSANHSNQTYQPPQQFQQPVQHHVAVNQPQNVWSAHASNSMNVTATSNTTSSVQQNQWSVNTNNVQSNNINVHQPIQHHSVPIHHSLTTSSPPTSTTMNNTSTTATTTANSSSSSSTLPSIRAGTPPSATTYTPPSSFAIPTAKPLVNNGNNNSNNSNSSKFDDIDADKLLECIEKHSSPQRPNQQNNHNSNGHVAEEHKEQLMNNNPLPLPSMD